MLKSKYRTSSNEYEQATTENYYRRKERLKMKDNEFTLSTIQMTVQIMMKNNHPKNDILDYLDGCRKQSPEVEDGVMEVIDIVGGWCDRDGKIKDITIHRSKARA